MPRSKRTSPRPEQRTIFLFTHSNRIKCLLKESRVHVEPGVDSPSMTIKETLEENPDNRKTFTKYFNNITFHIKKKSSGQYQITVLDAGSERSTRNKIGNDDLSYYRSGSIDNPEIDYLTIVEGPLTTSLRDNNIESIIISRHGLGRHNDWKDLRNTFAIADARLTAKGERETISTAIRVKEKIGRLGISAPEYVFTSELFRTMQTAALFMKELDYLNELRKFYIVRCNHELSSNQWKNDMCDSNIDTIIKSKKNMADTLKYRLRMGDENYPKRLENKIKSFCAQNNKCNGMDSITLSSEELNCSTRNYTEHCEKKGNMFDNINVVFYRNQEKDCGNYVLFINIKDIIDRSVEARGGTLRKSKRNKKSKTLRGKSKRNKKRKTLRGKSKRLTKKRNKRRTNKKRFTKRR